MDIPRHLKTIIYRLKHSRVIYTHPGEWLIAKYWGNQIPFISLDVNLPRASKFWGICDLRKAWFSSKGMGLEGSTRVCILALSPAGCVTLRKLTFCAVLSLSVKIRKCRFCSKLLGGLWERCMWKHLADAYLVTACHTDFPTSTGTGFCEAQSRQMVF